MLLIFACSEYVRQRQVTLREQNAENSLCEHQLVEMYEKYVVMLTFTSKI